jgi:hypothetical protein
MKLRVELKALVVIKIPDDGTLAPKHAAVVT